MTERQLQFPQKGKSRDEVLATMEAAREHDVKWRQGKVFSLVYSVDQEVSQLLKDAYMMFFSENGLNPTAFPSLRKFETEVVAMAAALLGGDENVVGNMTSGGTESLLMAVKTAREWARANRPEVTAPEMILPDTAHPAFDKASHYFDVKAVRVPVREDFRADVSACREAITPQTILMVGSAPSFPQGVVDPIAELAQIAQKHRLLFHVDACVGGFMLPFVRRLGYPIPEFDFQVPGVTSISADLHKYGYAAKPASLILYRNPELRRYQFFVTTDWSGGVYASPAMTGSRPGGSIATAIYFVVMLFVFDTIISLLTMALNALFPEIAPNLKERSSLSAYREAAAVIALLLAFILAPILSDELGWWQMGAILGAITAAGYLLCVIDNKEDPDRMTGEGLGLAESLRTTLANKSFRWFLGANLAKEYVFLILAATLPFWSKYCLGITGKSEVFGIMMGPGNQEAILLGVSFVLAIPFLAVWNRIMARIGVRKVWTRAFIIFIPGLIVVLFANNFYVGLLGTILIAPALSGSMMVYTVMLSEIIDRDAKRTRQRREGIYFGINGGITKLVFTVQGLLYAIILPLTKYDATLNVQPTSAIWGIRFLIAGSPIIACLIGLYFLRHDHLAEEVDA